MRLIRFLKSELALESAKWVEKDIISQEQAELICKEYGAVYNDSQKNSFGYNILAGVYLGAIYPLWFGKPIKLKTIPVDPRSLFRGNYAKLNYDISTVDCSHLILNKGLRSSEVIYIELKSEDNNIWAFDKASLSKPDSGIFIRGRIDNNIQFL